MENNALVAKCLFALMPVPRNKTCKSNNDQNLVNAKTAAKESNVEERLHTGCEMVQ